MMGAGGTGGHDVEREARVQQIRAHHCDGTEYLRYGAAVIRGGSRGAIIEATARDMKRLCNNYMQLTGPVFDPRSVANMNQNSLEILDLTGIP